MFPMPAPISVAILAGGHSRRMGRPKALLDFQGQPLLAHVLARVHDLGQETLLIANQPDLYASFGLPCLSDLIPDAGPLGGLYTALSQARYAWTLLVACDMPWLNPALLRALIALALAEEECIAVVPRWQTYPEALHALYHRHCLPTLRAALAAGRLKTSHYLEALPVRYVERTTITLWDPLGRSFTNLNTPADVAAAEQPGDSPDEA